MLLMMVIEVQIGMQYWHGVIEVTTITAAHETQSVKLDLATRPRTATNLQLTLICWPYTSVVVVGACVPLWTGLDTGHSVLLAIHSVAAGVWSHTPKGWLGVCVSTTYSIMFDDCVVCCCQWTSVYIN